MLPDHIETLGPTGQRRVLLNCFWLDWGHDCVDLFVIKRVSLQASGFEGGEYDPRSVLCVLLE